MSAPDRIWAGADSEDGWRWPYASKHPMQHPSPVFEYIRADLVMEWQPIETAPRVQRNGPDGLIIIGNQHWTKTVFFEKAGVISEPEYGDLWVTPDVEWTCPVDDCTATHWRYNDLPKGTK